MITSNFTKRLFDLTQIAKLLAPSHLCVIPLLLFVSICAADWPFARRDVASTGVAAGTFSDEPELLWEYKTPDSAFEAAPVVTGGVAYLGDADGTLHAVRLRDGQSVWTKNYENAGFLASGALSKDQLLVGDYNGAVRLLDASSADEIWSFDAEAEINAAPIIHRNVALVTSELGRLHALDLATGEEQWRFEIEDPLRCSPSVVAGHALLAGCDGHLHAINLASGKEAGSVGIGGPTGNSAAAIGTMAYFGTEGGQFYAIEVANPQTPKVIWTYHDPRRRQGIRTAAAVTEKQVVYGSQGKSIYCLDRTSGKPVWQAPQRSRVESSPLIVGDRVIAATARGRLLLLNLEDGELLWEYDAGGGFVAAPVVIDGQLLMASTDGVLYCFGGKKPLMNTDKRR